MSGRLHDIVALGEAMIELNEIEAGTYRQGFGGDTSNFAVAAARQGARVAYCSRLGDDRFGRLLLALWRDEGIDTAAVGIDAEAATGAYFIGHDATGHHFQYLRAGSAASRMRPRDVPDALIQHSRYLHVSGISQAISASACDTVFAALETARQAGVRVSYDPNLRQGLWPLARARAVIEATIAYADLFLPGFDEAALLAGVDSRDAVFDWCARHGARQVVLKCGADGAWIWSAGQPVPHHVAALAVPTVDASGAGDCFDGALVARLAAGDALEAAVRYANAAAALSTTGYGAVAPIPRPPAVLERLRAG